MAAHFIWQTCFSFSSSVMAFSCLSTFFLLVRCHAFNSLRVCRSCRFSLVSSPVATLSSSCSSRIAFSIDLSFLPASFPLLRIGEAAIFSMHLPPRLLFARLGLGAKQLSVVMATTPVVVMTTATRNLFSLPLSISLFPSLIWWLWIPDKLGPHLDISHLSCVTVRFTLIAFLCNCCNVATFRLNGI